MRTKKDLFLFFVVCCISFSLSKNRHLVYRAYKTLTATLEKGKDDPIKSSVLSSLYPFQGVKQFQK